MKSAFEKIARRIAKRGGLLHGDETITAIAGDLADLYAAGYRDGQERMRGKCYLIARGSTLDTVIEEAAIEDPPT